MDRGKKEFMGKIILPAQILSKGLWKNRESPSPRRGDTSEIVAITLHRKNHATEKNGRRLTYVPILDDWLDILAEE